MSTMDRGLKFQNDEDEKHIFTDASFNEVCMGCHLVMWGSSMLLWKAGQQSVITASTAEAELVEILEGALAGDAVKVVIEEILDLKSRAVSEGSGYSPHESWDGGLVTQAPSRNAVACGHGYQDPLGMYMGKEGQKEKSRDKKGEKNATTVDAERAKQALRAIIMFAKLAMAKSEFHDGLQLWTA